MKERKKKDFMICVKKKKIIRTLRLLRRFQASVLQHVASFLCLWIHTYSIFSFPLEKTLNKARKEMVRKLKCQIRVIDL